MLAGYECTDQVLAVTAGNPGVVVLLDPLLADDIEVSQLCDQLTGQPVLLLVHREDAGALSLSLSLAKQSQTVGVIATDVSSDDLADAVRKVADGQPVFDGSLALVALRASDSPLTDRERQVLKLIDTGATVQEVARIMCLSAGTIRNYLSRVLTKTGARSRIEAIRKAQVSGWI
ncbi:response regulator transcription factor [Kribbella sp. NPDC056861]|uniref:helix-turn-helix transcriptional regulator n=1 Tax=Kribbella sp. NPDC056861 TaxID=3154857 RepID=UPI00341E2F63